MAKTGASNMTDVKGEGFNRSSNDGEGFEIGAGWNSEAGVGKDEMGGGQTSPWAGGAGKWSSGSKGGEGAGPWTRAKVSSPTPLLNGFWWSTPLLNGFWWSLNSS